MNSSLLLFTMFAIGVTHYFIAPALRNEVINVFKKFKRKWVLLITLLLVWMPLMVCLIIYNSPESYPWLDFFGSIIGSAMTLIGVVWTLQHNQKLLKTQIAETRKPVIKVVQKESSLLTQTTFQSYTYIKECQKLRGHALCDDCDESPINQKYFKIVLNAKNIGDGYATNFKSRANFVGTLKNAKQHDIEYAVLDKGDDFDFTLLLHLPCLNILFDDFTANSKLYFDLEYEGELSRKYYTRLHFSYMPSEKNQVRGMSITLAGNTNHNCDINMNV